MSGNYGGGHQSARKRAIRELQEDGGGVCWRCGDWMDPDRPDLLELDHVVPIALGGLDESTPRVLVHALCNRRAGGQLSQDLARRRAGVSPARSQPAAPIEPDPIPWSDDCWRRPWLSRFARRWPSGSSRPRFATCPHPDATGSYGAAFLRWFRARHVADGIELHPWQIYVAFRSLEHDRAGRLVWSEVMVLAPRQQGKSLIVSELAAWRIEQGARFGRARQDALIVSRDVFVAGKVQTVSRRVAEQDPGTYETRESEGRQRITHLPSGSTFEVRSLRGAYGHTAACLLVDEAWCHPAAPIRDNLVPTAMRAESSQVIFASCAHLDASSLIVDMRAAEIARLRTPAATLLMEWSADPDADPDDVDALRAAMPHWTDTTVRFALAQLRTAQATLRVGESEEDPVRSWCAQYRSQWPSVPIGARKLGATMFDRQQVDDATERGQQVAAVFDQGPFDYSHAVFGIEDRAGEGVDVASVYRVQSGHLAVYHDAFGTRAAAAAAVHDAGEHFDGYVVLLGADLDTSVTDAAGLMTEKAGRTELAAGLPSVRHLLAAGLLAIDPDAEDLIRQLHAARAKPTDSGLALVRGAEQYALRPTVWALNRAAVDFGLLTDDPAA